MGVCSEQSEAVGEGAGSAASLGAASLLSTAEAFNKEACASRGEEPPGSGAAQVEGAAVYISISESKPKSFCESSEPHNHDSG